MTLLHTPRSMWVVSASLLMMIPLAAQPTYYASLAGDDTTGLTWATAFHDLQTAIDAAHAAATSSIRGQVLADAHVFDAPDGIRVRSRVTVIGQGIGSTVIRTEAGVVLEADSSIQRITIECVGAYEIVSALEGDMGPVLISRCAVDGAPHETRGAAAPTIGIMVVGGTAESVVIQDCSITAVDIGIYAVDSGVNITRCVFSQINGDAIQVATQGLRDTEAKTPLLGRADASNTTGLNWYREVSGFCVNNQTGQEVEAEVNDWDVYTASGVTGRVNGPVDTEPYLGKSIGPGSVVVTLKNAQGEVIPSASNPKCGIPAQSIVAEQDPVSKKFVMQSVPAGQHIVKASATGYLSAQAPVEVAAQNVSPLTILLSKTESPNCGASGKVAYALSFVIIWASGWRMRRTRKR